ncbi:MAG: efflux transporter outer membrane subunit [Gallionella sp.]|nr:efflux transporter outer membrane subunit [Gallionella sp.]
MGKFEFAHPEYPRFASWRGVAFTALFFLLAGCAAKRDHYNIPALDLPGQYAKAPASADIAHPEIITTRTTTPSDASTTSSPLSAALTEWWRLLGSQELNGLMDRALANNPDLRIAALRIAQSKARLDQAGADKAPTISVPVQVKNEYPESGIGRGNPNGNNKSRTTHQISIRGDWRPDIWGEAYSLYEAAELQLLRATYQRDDIQRNVVADVVVNYMEYLSLNDRLKVARETEKSLGEMLASVDARREVGDATITDMEQQKAAVYQVKATIPVLEQQREVVLNRLASLAGSAPVAMKLSDSGLDTAKFPLVLPGVPSALLLRRPDVRAVEARLLAADADIDVARARVLPPLDLTAQVGYGSTYLSKLFMPQALFWNAIANLSATIFDSGKRSSEVEFAQAVHEELVETYVRVIYDAVREVDDSLSAISFMGKRLEAQGVATDSALRAWNFSQEAFMAGAVDYLVVLDTQRTYQRNLDDWYSVRMERYRGLVNLFAALGGGVPGGDALPGDGLRPVQPADEADFGAVLAEMGAMPKAENDVAQKQAGSHVPKVDAASRSKAQTEGIDWAGNALRDGATSWLAELSGVYDRGAVLPAWRDLRARFPRQIESRTLLPQRQGQVNAASKERASWYRLYVATFSDKKAAEEFCATLSAGQQRCAVVSSQLLAGKGDFVAPSASAQPGSAAMAAPAEAEPGAKATAEAEAAPETIAASAPEPAVAEVLPVAVEASSTATEVSEQNAGQAADVLQSVRSWAAAWSNKDVRDYLAAYTPDFKQSGMNHAAWKTRRTKLVGAAKTIEVTLSGISVSVHDSSHATVSFAQSYRSDTLHSQVEKTLQLTKQSDRWLIAEERVVKPAKILEKTPTVIAPNQVAKAARETPLPGARRFDGVDWSGQQFWLVELFDAHLRRAITGVWLDLLTRFPAQMKSRTILPRRQDITGDAGENRPSRYQLFIARFTQKQEAEAFCAMLRDEQQDCGVVPSQSLAQRYALNTPTIEKGVYGQRVPDHDAPDQNTAGGKP